MKNYASGVKNCAMLPGVERKGSGSLVLSPLVLLLEVSTVPSFLSILPVTFDVQH